jgi:hypothetical protein
MRESAHRISPPDLLAPAFFVLAAADALVISDTPYMQDNRCLTAQAANLLIAGRCFMRCPVASRSCCGIGLGHEPDAAAHAGRYRDVALLCDCTQVLMRPGWRNAERIGQFDSCWRPAVAGDVLRDAGQHMRLARG